MVATTARIVPARLGLPPAPEAARGLCRSVTARLPHGRYAEFRRRALDVAHSCGVSVDTFDGGDLMIARFRGSRAIDRAALRFSRAIASL